MIVTIYIYICLSMRFFPQYFEMFYLFASCLFPLIIDLVEQQVSYFVPSTVDLLEPPGLGSRQIF